MNNLKFKQQMQRVAESCPKLQEKLKNRPDLRSHLIKLADLLNTSSGVSVLSVELFEVAAQIFKKEKQQTDRLVRKFYATDKMRHTLLDYGCIPFATDVISIELSKTKDVIHDMLILDLRIELREIAQYVTELSMEDSWKAFMGSRINSVLNNVNEKMDGVKKLELLVQVLTIIESFVEPNFFCDDQLGILSN